MPKLKKPIWCERLHFLLDIFDIRYYLMSDISDIIWYIWCQWCLILQKLDKFVNFYPRSLLFLIPMMSDIIWYIWCQILFGIKNAIYYLIPKVANISDFALKTWLFLFNLLIFFLNLKLEGKKMTTYLFKEGKLVGKLDDKKAYSLEQNGTFKKTSRLKAVIDSASLNASIYAQKSLNNLRNCPFK